MKVCLTAVWRVMRWLAALTAFCQMLFDFIKEVYDLIRCERIKSIRIGHQIRVPKDALLQFLQMADN